MRDSGAHLVGLISDTHGLIRPGVHDAVEGVELILPAGDVVRLEILDELRLVAPLDVSDGRYDALARTLPSDERDRAASLTPIARRRFVVARGILRKLLAGFTGTAAEKLQFSYGHAGKPILIDRDDIHFNVSHSADLGLFAFAPDRPVGVDVENERPVRRLLDVAQRFMSDEELRTLAAAPDAERNSAFLRSWVV